MSKLKLVIVGQATCTPCVILKKQILSRIEEFKVADCDFEYISLNDLDDKDAFIQAHRLTSTPSVWYVKDGHKLKEHAGYVDVDTLVEWAVECNE